MQALRDINWNRMVPEHITTMTEKEILEFPGIKEFIEKNRDKLSANIIQNSISKFNEFIRSTKNPIEPGYEPHLFINIGYIDVGYRKSKVRISQEKQLRDQARIKNETMSKQVREASFDSIHYTLNRMDIIKYLKMFITEFNLKPDDLHKGLYISGTYGVGKTYMLSAMANRLVQLGHTVRVEHFPTFLNNLNTLDWDDRALAVNEIKKEQVLVLDDFGSDNLTEYIRDSVILVILEYRMANFLPTFFTSNLTLAELKEYLAHTKNEVDYRKSERIMERVEFLAQELVLTGTNKRNPGTENV